MKTSTQHRIGRGGFAFMEGLLVLAVLTWLFLGFCFGLPRFAAVVECLALAALVATRARNIVTVTRMNGGRPPLVLNRRWPLLVATVAIAWLVGVELLAFAVATYREAGIHAPHPETLGLGAEILGFLAALAITLLTVAAPFVVGTCWASIARETDRWKNSGPRADPPPSFGPVAPTGLAPAPLPAFAELAFA